MKEPAEDKLVNKIRQVFNEYEDTSAANGWNELVKKYPAQKTRNPFLLWMSSAAAILLISGLWFFNLNEPINNIAQNKAKIRVGQPKLNFPITDTISTSKLLSKNDKLPNNKLNNRVQNIVNKSESNSKTVNTVVILKFKKPTENKLPTNIESTPEINVLPESNAAQTFSMVAPDTSNKSTNSKTNLDIIPTQKSDLSYPSKKIVIALNQPLSPLTLPDLTEDSKNVVIKENKKLAMSFYAGTYMNYSKGSESVVNLGAGLSSDIPLAKNFKLTTGLSISNNTLKFSTLNGNSSEDKIVLSNKIADGANINRSGKGLAADASSGYLIYDELGLNSNLGSSLPISKAFIANFLMIDIPINLKYNLNFKKNNIYILGGLSSGSYLQEKYSYEETVSINNQTLIKNNKKANQILKSFDFAKTLNLSMGLSTKLTKNQSITLEPFLKYPIGGLGSQDIQFGSTGINLKLDINSKSK